MRITVATYTFHELTAAGKMDVFGCMETCRYRYGLDQLELWHGTMGPLERIFDVAFQKAVLEGMKERGLTFANYHVDHCHIWEDDPDRREKHYQVALKQLQVAAALGARTMRIDAGCRNPTWNAEQFDHIVGRYREYCAFAADHGFRIGPENHWGPEVDVGEMDRLIQAVDHPSFGVLLHLGRWKGVPPADGDRRFAPRAFHVHVGMDYVRDGFEAAARELDSSGYTGCYGVEHVDKVNPYAATGAMIAEVNRVLDLLRTEKEKGVNG